MHPISIFIAMFLTAVLVGVVDGHCLSQDDASAIVEGYTNLITKTQANFNLTLATQLLASDYHSSSDGVDYVREEPVRLFLSAHHARGAPPRRPVLSRHSSKVHLCTK